MGSMAIEGPISIPIAAARAGSLHGQSALAPAGQAVFEGGDILETVKPEKFGQFLGQGAAFAVAVGNDP